MCRPENTNKSKQSVQQSDLHVLYWSNEGGRRGQGRGSGGGERRGGEVGEEREGRGSGGGERREGKWGRREKGGGIVLEHCAVEIREFIKDMMSIALG